MEDLMLNLFLFTVIYSFLCRLYSGSKQHSLTRKNEAWQMNEANEIIIENDSEEVKVIKPIEQQLKDIWQEIDKPIESIEKPQEEPTIEELPKIEQLLEGIEVKNINVIAARKIASRLQIKQTINRKKRSKASLIEDIEKELKANPIKIAPIIVESMA